LICRVCDSENLEIVIDLGSQPWCNNFLHEEELGREPFYPLRVVFCTSCRTAQLDHTVPKEVMFGNHTYLSGITESLSNHFREVSVNVDRTFFSNLKSKSILDIGSNDGTQLKHYLALGYDVLGVESSKATSNIANENGLNTINAFFNLDLAKSLDRKFDVINASGVFFHLEELHSVASGINYALKKDGVFVVQFLYMKKIIENMAFDQIYHEHLLYYNLETINFLLNRHDLEMFDAYLSPIHGGSIIGFIGHKGLKEKSDRLKKLIHDEFECKSNDIECYIKFSKNIEKMKIENIEYLNSAKAAGKKIYGMGAPVKGNTLLNYFGIGVNHIDYLVEKNELRKGLFSPGMHIPIVIEKDIKDLPDIYYVLAWNFKKEILEKNKKLIDKGIEFYFPVNPR
jgi:SAM-dependent methyltransferase